MAYMGIESKKQWIYVYVELIHFTVHLKLTQIVSQLYSKILKKPKQQKTKTNKKKWYVGEHSIRPKRTVGKRTVGRELFEGEGGGAR